MYFLSDACFLGYDLYTFAFMSLNTERMRITSSGSFGIGTAYDENFSLIYRVRVIYAEKSSPHASIMYGKSASEHLDSVVLGLLEHLRGENIIFMGMGKDYGKVKTGVVISVKGRKVHIREGYMKRRLDIKNLIVYHPSILAALSML